MSLDEMIVELPKLSLKERQKLASLALELDDNMAFCNEAARQGFNHLDAIENQAETKLVKKDCYLLQYWFGGLFRKRVLIKPGDVYGMD